MDEIQHFNPIWKTRADFIIAGSVHVDDETIIEQLWAKRLDSHLFELCCIPFHLYNLSLGDTVHVNDDFVVDQLITPSGRYVFRVFKEDGSLRGNEMVNQVERLGGAFEWNTDSFAAVDAVNLSCASAIARLLMDLQGAGQIHFDTGRQ